MTDSELQALIRRGSFTALYMEQRVDAAEEGPGG